MQFFTELGSQIEQRWKDRNYDEPAFPEIAAHALAEASLNTAVSPWDILRWLFNATHIPGQQDVPGAFGNPPITLYSGPRFCIDIYFWLDGATAIHQHAFSGAFQVLLGSSIHTQYRFDRRKEINPHFIVGDIVLEGVDLLEQGCTKQIAPGARYIHSLFHLDRPSATICVRTYHTISGAPQFSYHKPYFAIDPFFKEPLSIKQAQSAELLFKMRHPETEDILTGLIARSDFHSAFTLLGIARQHLTTRAMERSFGLTAGQELFEKLLERTRHRHGALTDLIVPVLEESDRQEDIVHRRGQITGNEHRFFLALLLNVPDRTRVLQLVQQRFPQSEPVQTVVTWIEELAATKVWGSPEPNVLGIANPDDDYLFVFQCLLQGFSLEKTIDAWSEEFPGTAVPPADIYCAIRDSALFKSIFQSDRVGATD